jgi:hypothetical protein
LCGTLRWAGDVYRRGPLYNIGRWRTLGDVDGFRKTDAQSLSMTNDDVIEAFVLLCSATSEFGYGALATTS